MLLELGEDLAGVRHPRAVEQPAPPLCPQGDDLGHRFAHEARAPKRGLDLALDELTRPPVDPRQVGLGRTAPRHDRDQVSEVDQRLHRDVVGHRVEESADQRATVQPVRRRREAEDLHVGVHELEIGQGGPVHGLGASRNQVRLVDQHQVEGVKVRDSTVDALDSCV